MFREDTIITQCQDEFRYLSGCVKKILTASRMLQISIARCQIESEIHSFPAMYGKGGVDVVKIGEIKVSVQKICLKQGFFEDTNLDHFTSGWPWSNISSFEKRKEKCRDLFSGSRRERDFLPKKWTMSVEMSYGHAW